MGFEAKHGISKEHQSFNYKKEVGFKVHVGFTMLSNVWSWIYTKNLVPNLLIIDDFKLDLQLQF
jgi:hypothetical protein